MSDFPEGTDWWKASDGRWYAPPPNTSGDPPAEVAEPQPERLVSNRTGWLILAGLFLALVVAISVVSSDDTDDGSSERAVQADAYRVCKDFVTDRLRAPGTARFPDFFDFDGEVTVVPTASGFQVSSHVDSENGFGALVRTLWVCDLAESGDRWLLRDLDLAG